MMKSLLGIIPFSMAVLSLLMSADGFSNDTEPKAQLISSASVSVTFLALVAPGGAYNDTNKATVRYYDPDNNYPVLKIVPGIPVTVYAAPNKQYRFYRTLDGSDGTCHRWSIYGDPAGMTPLVGSATYCYTFYEQWLPTITIIGTDFYHSVSTESYHEGNLDVNVSGIVSKWYRWTNKGSTFTLTGSTTGTPTRYTNDTRSWVVNTCFTATVHYKSPSIPVTFAAFLQHGSATTANTATINYFDPEGISKHVHPAPGHSISVAAMPGSTYSFSPGLAGSDTCHRWWSDQASAGILPATGYSVVSRTYTEQYKANISLPGADADHLVATEAHWYFGQNHTEQDVTNPWNEWCDSGSQLLFSNPTLGTPARFTTDIRQWTMNTCLDRTISYLGPSISVTFAAVLQRGSWNPGNAATVTYYDPTGIFRTIYPSKDSAISVSAAVGSAYTFSPALSKSDACHRWWCNQNLSGTLPDSGYTEVQRFYSEQYRVNIALPGANADHSVATLARLFCGQQLTETGIQDPWNNWCDVGSDLIFSGATTGTPSRLSTDTRSWNVNSCLNKTISYYGPSIPVTFAAFIQRGSASPAITAAVNYYAPSGTIKTASPAIGQSVSVAVMPGSEYIYSATLNGVTSTCHRWACNQILSGTVSITDPTTIDRRFFEQWKPSITIDCTPNLLKVEKHIQFGEDMALTASPFGVPSAWSEWTDTRSQLVFNQTMEPPGDNVHTNLIRGWPINDCFVTRLCYAP